MKFNVETGFELVNELVQCLDVVEEENDRLQHNFQALNSSFKDAYYQEFASEFEAGDKSIKKLKENVHDVATKILRYTKYLAENENM